MKRFQEHGDYSAFETLFQRHKDPFVSFLVRLAGDATIAEDVSQQVWLTLIEVARGGRYRAKPGGSFKAYLYTLGRNRYVDDHVRKHEASRTESHAAPELVADQTRSTAEDTACPARSLDSERAAELLHAELAKLPFEQRDVIALWASGVELKLVAEMSGVPRNTVLSRKKYAVKKLRAALDAREE